jgi:proteasome lid subunit RPN8/RPN11
MNFSIAKTIHRLCVPEHELSCSWLLWYRLLTELRQRGRYGKNESGAFLLGKLRAGRARIVQFVLYDDLDPNSLKTGIVRFDGRYFGELWDICRRRGVSVVADVHTHPEGPEQSDSDRANPMISIPGHIAIIVPRFATPPVRRERLGIYQYQGSKRWRVVSRENLRMFLHIGF